MAFESILNKSNKKGLISSSSGSFDFDIVTVESHTSTLKIVENPIETGSNISDHAVLEPKEVSITGIMVGYNRPPKFTPSMFGIDLDDSHCQLMSIQ